MLSKVQVHGRQLFGIGRDMIDIADDARRSES